VLRDVLVIQNNRRSSRIMIHNIVFIISSLFLLAAANVGAYVPVPRFNITILSGQSSRLNCSRDYTHPVEWYHEPVGSGIENLVYALSNIYGYYRSRGRHKIVKGTHDLLVSNATESEAGVYTCKDADLGMNVDTYSLIVLQSRPHCTSNRSLNNVLVDNDCALTPDHIELNCSVTYRGNFEPVLKWRHSTQPDILVSMSTSQHQVNSVVTSTLELKPQFHFNGTYFICSVEDLVSDSHIGMCSTQNITIAYIFQPATTISEDAKTITCVANTSSKHCVYRWLGNHVPTNVNIESPNQTLPLDESLNNLRCETKCRIGSDDCSVTSSIYSSSTHKKKIAKEGYSVSWIILYVISTVLVIGLMLLCIISIFRKYNTYVLPEVIYTYYLLLEIY
jgi:hypothetical protein